MIAMCPNCGGLNNVPEAKLADVAAIYKMDVAKLKEELTKANNLENFMTNLSVDATMEKTVLFIQEQAK